ncbi:MAG: ATP-binding protein [Leptospira sp.]|nr:ATP-binding protein [Leptospira sp.]
MVDLGSLLKSAIEGNYVGKAVIEVSFSVSNFKILYSNRLFQNFSKSFSVDDFLQFRVQTRKFSPENLFLTDGRVLSTRFGKFELAEGKKESEYYNLYIEDITVKFRQEEEIAWRMRFELGVSSSLQIFIRHHDIEATMPQGLYHLLQFTEMDSVFFLKWVPSRSQSTYQTLANELKSEQIKPIPKELNGDWAKSNLNRWHKKIQKGKILYLTSDKALPKERWYFESGREDLLLIPVISHNVFYGCLGFERQKKHSPIKKDNILVYQSIASWLGIFLERDKAIHELNQYKNSLESLVADRTLDLENTKLELEKAYKAKSDFLAHMSHELRTPLNSILGFSKLIQLPDSDLSGKEYLGYINTAGTRLLTMINDILNLIRLESGDLKIYEIEFDPTEVFETSKRLIQPIADSKGMFLESKIIGKPFRVKSDPGKLQQILTNLLSNAIKYGSSHPKIEFNLKFSENELEFIVTDFGQGISEEDQKKLFQNFSRLGEDGNIEGAGLGLSISQKLASLLQGSLILNSKPGEGSSFTLILPNLKN